MKTLSFFLLFLLFQTPILAQVSVGEAAPDFSLPVLNTSETFTLSQLQNKVVYIFFYGAGCSHCRGNGPVTETEIYQPLKSDTNFVAIGIDTWNNNTSTNNSFKNVTQITYPLLLNARDVLVAYYGNTTSYDRSVVIGADGILRYRGTNFVSFDYEDVIEIIEDELVKTTTASENEADAPDTFNLAQNYPNPFNPETVISYQLPVNSTVKLQIFDSIGREIALLVNEFQTAGQKSIRWNATAQPSGMYYYRLASGGTVLTKKMMLIK